MESSNRAGSRCLDVVTSAVPFLFLISALPVLASFPGPPSLHGDPRNLRLTGYELQAQEREFIFLDSFRESPRSAAYCFTEPR